MRKRYNVCVELYANVVVYGETRDGAEAAIEQLLAREDFLRIGDAEFVLESENVTGIFDADWNELPRPPSTTPEGDSN
jgi:hypothetical protein